MEAKLLICCIVVHDGFRWGAESTTKAKQTTKKASKSKSSPKLKDVKKETASGAKEAVDDKTKDVHAKKTSAQNATSKAPTPLKKEQDNVQEVQNETSTKSQKVQHPASTVIDSEGDDEDGSDSSGEEEADTAPTTDVRYTGLVTAIHANIITGRRRTRRVREARRRYC